MLLFGALITAAPLVYRPLVLPPDFSGQIPTGFGPTLTVAGAARSLPGLHRGLSGRIHRLLPTSVLDFRPAQLIVFDNHQRHRLGILTIAAETKRVTFAHLRDALNLTAGNLSRHITVLNDAGLLVVDKGYQGRRPKTWIRITPAGPDALARELATLRVLLDVPVADHSRRTPPDETA
jgi:DNA-binding MarR family transcriptional regulator